MTVTGRAPGQTARQWMRDRGDLVWRKVFDAEPAQVPQARRFTQQLLAGDEFGDAALIVTELANNALQHTRSGSAGGWFGVELILGSGLRISVTDLGGNGRPVVHEAETLDTGGRGLQLVAELAYGYGVAGDPEHGHTVWAEILPSVDEHSSGTTHDEVPSEGLAPQRPQGAS